MAEPTSSDRDPDAETSQQIPADAGEVAPDGSRPPDTESVSMDADSVGVAGSSEVPRGKRWPIFVVLAIAAIVVLLFATGTFGGLF